MEISCHGSNYIIQSTIQLLIKTGARLAKPGEFTQRAFINGRLDLAQAEAVADLIAAESESAHATAMKQMRGGFSKAISELRDQLVHFASMIELELDFSEEDVEFANRKELKALVKKIQEVVDRLMHSFQLGNVLKNGIPVVIAGKPNVGKSTLLNALLNEDKAIVSDIPGTTRDSIEDTLNIEGVLFRFIDTAGLRETKDEIEAIGVEKTRNKLAQASLIVLMFDLTQESQESMNNQIQEIASFDTPYLLIGNKIDEVDSKTFSTPEEMVYLSAKTGQNLDKLKSEFRKRSNQEILKTEGTVVTSARHYESLKLTKEALERVVQGIDENVSSDFVALDIRQALAHLGEISGEITTDDLLANIFSKFCIGK